MSSTNVQTFFRQFWNTGVQKATQVSVFVKIFGSCSWENLKKQRHFLKPGGNIHYVCFRARLKNGWVVWDPCFSLPFPSETTDTSGKGCFFSSLQRPCESSDFAYPSRCSKTGSSHIPPLCCEKEVKARCSFSFQIFICWTEFLTFEIFGEPRIQTQVFDEVSRATYDVWDISLE